MANGLHTLTDNFTTKDTAKWNYFGTAGVTSGQLSIPCQASYGDGLDSTNFGLLDLRGSMYTVQIVTPLNVGTGTTEAFFTVRLNSSNALGFYISGTTFGFRETVATVNSDTTTTFSSVTHKWVRLDHRDPGTIYWQTSTDGIAWTTQRSKAPGATWTGIFAEFVCGFYGTEPSPGTLLLDNFNLPLTTASQPRPSFYRRNSHLLTR